MPHPRPAHPPPPPPAHTARPSTLTSMPVASLGRRAMASDTFAATLAQYSAPAPRDARRASELASSRWPATSWMRRS